MIPEEAKQKLGILNTLHLILCLGRQPALILQKLPPVGGSLLE
jgi:hypothetical protein